MAMQMLFTATQNVSMIMYGEMDRTGWEKVVTVYYKLVS
jgi:hypothetical protein